MSVYKKESSAPEDVRKLSYKKLRETAGYLHYLNDLNKESRKYFKSQLEKGINPMDRVRAEL